jgi:peptide deformylase
MNSGILKIAKPKNAKYKKKVFLNSASTADFICQIGEAEFLRKPSKKVLISKIKSPQMQGKFKYLRNCLRKYTKLTGQGRGIAGVQVGIPEQFFAVYTTLDKDKIEIFINPQITKKSKVVLKYPEMCMSAVPVIAPLARPSWIEFEYWDEKGNLKKWITKDKTKLGQMLNRVFQHEIDHLDGVINIDRIKSPKELILDSDPEFYPAPFCPVRQNPD